MCGLAAQAWRADGLGFPEMYLHVFMLSTPTKACKNNHMVKFQIWDGVSFFWLHVEAEAMSEDCGFYDSD